MTAVPRPDRRSVSRPLASHRRGALAVAMTCFAIAGYLFLHQGDQRRVRTASQSAATKSYDAAISEARRVSRGPAETAALLVRAHVAQAQRRHADAVSLFRRAAERDPRAWHVHRDWAVSLLALGRRAEARRRLEVAASLNPRLVPPVGF